MHSYKSTLKPLSRQLRNNMTEAEQVLWSRLRHKQILGLQFYRQKPLAGYIADFYCPAARLVIEVDGSQHHEIDCLHYDNKRDRVLGSLGLLVMRFDNRQVLIETDSVLEQVYKVVGERLG